MKKILIAEDSATMRLFIRMSLRKLPDVVIIEAVDGLDALEKMKSHEVDAVITDIHMPRLGGLELIERIRRMPGPGIPIIILSTDGEKEDLRRGLALGANTYATKPIVGPAFANLVSDSINMAA